MDAIAAATMAVVQAVDGGAEVMQTLTKRNEAAQFLTKSKGWAYKLPGYAFALEGQHSLGSLHAHPLLFTCVIMTTVPAPSAILSSHDNEFSLRMKSVLNSGSAASTCIALTSTADCEQ